MTFSIVARDANSGTLGIAISTARVCVGAGCTFVKTGVGAIASQSLTNPRLGIDGLRLLEVGLEPENALTALLREDAQAALRQAGVVDAQGRVFAFTGAECVDWCGHRTGDNYTVQGNMLVGRETIDAMAEAFESTAGILPVRLIAALEAGQAAGGDKRGRISAAIVARPPASALWEGVDIRVDEHADPVAELRRIFDIVQANAERLRAEAEKAAKKA